MTVFNRENLPFNNTMKNFWEENGFLVINNFYSNAECDVLINKSDELIKNFNIQKIKSFFDTKKQNHVDDRYFLDSGDKIRFFFEDKLLTIKESLLMKKNF